nr:retrovirus-related Pol polyprotein from transposon TNT 1-94 [Tanacetum cinerariifolium]
MLKKFGLEDSKPIKTHMSSETKLTRDEDGEPIDDTKYRGMIGSLLYLTANRPGIMFSVCLYARFQEAPKTSCLEVVKRIFRYIKHLNDDDINLLLTPKSTPPPLISPPLTPTQPSKLTSPLAINLDPIELLFSTPPTSPQAFLDSLRELSPSTTNPPPPRPSFDTIERMANEPPPIPPIE